MIDRWMDGWMDGWIDMAEKKSIYRIMVCKHVGKRSL